MACAEAGQSYLPARKLPHTKYLTNSEIAGARVMVLSGILGTTSISKLRNTPFVL
ncbi:hypothetical protein CCACVL1_14564 [Corchorus capsularis]|uniref:Uncharacterized protein n=1 Tax=Corchorus capsularis TaxID=210143 RepID=A0A1R3I6T8_COCAP|nr:hypothetical protein CCACVL1_14564 [Corchorus capsularis]